jgi:rod shape-determining protein MreC
MALPSRARRTRLLVIGLVSVSLVTITLDYRQGDQGPLSTVGDAALAVISPLQEGVSRVTKPVGNFFSTLVRLPAIRRENRELRDRVAELEQEVATTTADAARLQQLEALLGLRETLGVGISTTAAEVIANGVSNFDWTITIDKGSGVVELILDPDSSVAGRLDVSRSTGLLTGEGDREMEMGLVDTDTEVQPGEQVVTAGYAIPGVGQGLYPPGILIGSVSRVLGEDVGLEKYITVRPAVDFSTLDVVLVVLSDGSE